MFATGAGVRYLTTRTSSGSGGDGLVTEASLKTVAGNHALQSTFAQRPTLRNPSGSLYTFDFDGTDDVYSIPGLTAAGNTGKRFSFVVGVKNLPGATATDQQIIRQGITTLNQRSWTLEKAAANNRVRMLVSPDGTAGTYVSSGYSSDVPDNVFAAVSDGTEVRFYVGLTLLATLAVAPFGSTAQLLLGWDGSGTYGNVELSQVLFVAGRTFTDDQRIAATRYVAEKTGITL
jgi:hypothetical protein